MNRVTLACEGVRAPAWTDGCLRFCRRVLGLLGKDRWDASLLLCNDAFIRDLNARSRKLDRPTDVLTFSQAEGEALPAGRNDRGRFTAGDVVISLDSLRSNSQNYGVTEEEELKRLLVHGFLHLAGRDHPTDQPLEPMLVEQEKLLALLAGARIMSKGARRKGKPGPGKRRK
jgi:probable rRNA maturation factor